MKRTLLKVSAASLALTTLALPAFAGSAPRRITADGKVAAQTVRKATPQGKQQMLNLNRIMQKSRMTSEGLGPIGNLTINTRQLPGEVNHLGTRSAEAPRTTVYATVPSSSQGGGYSNCLFGKLDLATGQFSKVYSGVEYSLGEDYYYLTSCIVDDIIYIPAYTQDMVTGAIDSFWRRVDLETGQQLGNIYFGDDISGFCYALTYNPQTKKFYGLGMNLVSGTGSEFYEFDITNPDKPKKEYLGNIQGISGSDVGYASSLAYNPVDGELYTIKGNGRMYIVPQTFSPKLIQVKEFLNDVSFDEYKAIPDIGYPACLTYSPRDHAFVTIFKNPVSKTMEIVMIDVDNDYEVFVGNTTSLFGYYSSLVCVDPYADDDAPAQTFIDNIAKENAALNGTVEFTAPTENYAGLAITGQKLTVRTYIDGQEIDNRVVTPGEKYSVPFTTTQGNHTFTIQPEFDLASGVVKGPESKIVRWIGHDHPAAPANVVISDNKITWDAVSDKGQHKGYVDTSAVTYDVYFDDVKQNKEGIKGTEFNFDTPKDLARRNVNVIANANGLASEKSADTDAVFGEALSLPVSITPTEAQSKLFTTVKGKSIYDFKFIDGPTPVMGIVTTQYSDAPDNWLFMPKIKFDSTDHLYQMAVSYSNYFETNEKNQSNLKICIGKSPRPEDMTTVIYERENANVRDAVNIDALFSVPEPGEYYIGFYTTVALVNNSRGIKLWNFGVEGLDGVSVKSPGACSDVVVTPAPEGELAATFTFKFPTEAIDGTPLADDCGDITIEASCGDKKATATGRPGQNGTVKVESEKDGFNFFDLTTYYDGKRTVKRSYRAYLGVDLPLAPQNIKGLASADNKSLKITWDPVTKGVNGGWINPKSLKYEIMTVSTVNVKLGETKQCEYTYTPSTSKQSAHYVGPVAVSDQGSSVNSEFVYDFLGDLWEIPMSETFTPTGIGVFEIWPWKFNAKEEFSDCVWQHTNNLNVSGIGNPGFTGGGFYCTSLGARKWGELFAPKASTVNIHEARIGLKYWNYKEAGELYIYGKRYGHEEPELLFTITPTRPETAGWVEWNELLPAEYQDCPWIQLNVRTKLTNAENSLTVLDYYKIYQDVDHDFRIQSVSGPASVWTGETPTFNVTAGNAGLEAGRSRLIVKLLGEDGTVLARQNQEMRRLSPGANFYFTVKFEMKPEYAKYKKLRLVGTIDDPEDEVAINNEKFYEFEITDNHLPIVSELNGEWNDTHDKVTVSWNEPDNKFGAYDSFEFEEPFKNRDVIGEWKNVDMDKQSPFGIENATWEGYADPSAWIAFHPATLKLENEDRFKPHSGDIYLMARSCSYDANSEQPVQAADWLISPEVVGGSKVSFWMNCADAQYTETIELWYSTTDDQLGETIENVNGTYTCGSFKRIRPFSKSRADLWEYCEANLPKDAKYFALVYRSWGQFCAMIDDVTYTPVNLPEWTIEGYDVYRHVRSGENEGKYENVAWHTPLTSVTDETIGDNNVSYYVHTVVSRKDGRRFTSPRGSELRLYSLAVDDITALQGVQGGRGEIIVNGLEGDVLAIYTTDGKFLRQVSVASSHENIGIDAGIYVVKCGNKIAKVVVK